MDMAGEEAHLPPTAPSAATSDSVKEKGKGTDMAWSHQVT